MVVMHIIHHIKPRYVEHYIKATQANAQATMQEKGNLRFDVLRDPTDPCRFILYEAYIDKEAQQEHLSSEHFKVWLDAVQDVFSDRSFHKFEGIHVPQLKQDERQ